MVEASTGSALWNLRSEHELLNAIKTEEPNIPDNLPVPISEVVRGCLRRDYHQRWTAEQIVARLRKHQGVGKRRESPEARISLLSMGGTVSRAGNKYRFHIHIEAKNDGNCTLGWSGVTINVPTINSRELFNEIEIQMSSLGSDTPLKHGPGDEIFGFLDDGSFGKKRANSLFMESVLEHWPPNTRIALEAVLLTSCSRLDVHLRTWSNRPTDQGEEAFGDPGWRADVQKDQQGIPTHQLSIGFN